MPLDILLSCVVERNHCFKTGLSRGLYMKITSVRIISFSLLFSLSLAADASMSYECWSYKGGDLGKMVHVTADNRDEAAILAAAKFKKLSVKFDKVKCK